MTHFVHVEAVMVTYSGAAAFEENRQHCIQAARNMCTEPHCRKSPLKTINALHVRVGVAVHQFSDCVPGVVLGSSFAGYVPLASQNPLPHYSLFCGQL